MFFLLKTNRFCLPMLILLTLGVCSCSPNNFPFFKEKSQQLEKEITTKTEETVTTSDELKRLDGICRNLPEIPQMKVLKKSLSRKNNNKLFYYYFTEKNLTELKNADILYLHKNGWTIKDSFEDFEAYKIEFRKDNFSMEIDYGNYDGSGESNYVTNCEEFRE
jgi:hypothetical protein